MNRSVLFYAIVIGLVFAAIQYLYTNYFLNYTEIGSTAKVQILERQSRDSDAKYDEELQEDPTYMIARNVKRKQDLEKYKRALELYFALEGEYPPSLAKLTPDFFPIVLKDPSTFRQYTDYFINFSSSGYKVCVDIEHKDKESTRECFISEKY